jgi:hypothetical protein
MTTKTTDKPAVPAVNVKALTLTKADVRAFEKAAERRVGRPAYEDWRTIGRVYWKAWSIASAKVGDSSPHNPLVKKEFGQIIADLPAISDSGGTTRIYRAALLNIQRAEPGFSEWYQANQPRAASPPDLWEAYRATLPGHDRDKRRERQVNGHERELAQARQEDAVTIAAQQDRIAELETGNLSAKASVEDLVRRAWDAAWREHDFNPRAVKTVHARLRKVIDALAAECNPAETAAAGGDDAA